MFNHIIRQRTGLIPIEFLANKRYFGASSFVYKHKHKGNHHTDNKQSNDSNDAKQSNGSNEAKTSNDPNNNNKMNDPNDTKQSNNAVNEAQKQQEGKESNLEDQLKDCTTKYKALQESYLLSLADQENLRQRTTREVDIAKEYGIQKFAKDILDTIDILGMALNSVPKEYQELETCMQKDSKELAEQLVNLYKGVSMTETELQKTLKRYGVEKDDPIDQEFDPNKHEAVFQAPVPDKKPGTVFSVQKVGYLFKSRVLRPAQVGVVADNN